MDEQKPRIPNSILSGKINEDSLDQVSTSRYLLPMTFLEDSTS